MKQSFIYDDDGERLDVFMSGKAADYSRAQIKRAIESGAVCIDGSVCVKAGRKLRRGEKIDWELPDLTEPGALEADPDVRFRILYTDDHIIVIDKPAGLVVHPGAGNPDKTLINGLLAQFPEVREIGEAERPGIVHRLDAETSGLLIVARSQAAYEKLVAMFARHDIHRQYWAICLAPKLPDSGRFDTPYGRHPTQRVKYSSKFENEKRAVTDFRVIARNERGFALVTCLLQTGRTHQVRVHLSDHNAPILADPLYAPQNVLKNKFIQRLALHAGKLVFSHPVTGEHCEFKSPFPEDFASALRDLNLCPESGGLIP